jgi:hypothetical protein
MATYLPSVECSLHYLLERSSRACSSWVLAAIRSDRVKNLRPHVSWERNHRGCVEQKSSLLKADSMVWL